ncbi:YeiH family protein [Erythrobacter rubeus]|uniref:Sulfate exporter family transporter n=1 Tax=Erythrobacter rubeus TaxID=2760803 RepID=A0ABR8KQ93_9SPHN|nr:putative sulfate exporter family transporter [Erythrobacter rubeus]MBD2842916.1 putative sulfate exporter family transporter [Erythrobacter rubeus]
MSKPHKHDPVFTAGDLYGEIYIADQHGASAEKPRLVALLPGLALVATAAAAAGWLSNYYSVPLVLAGLLVGFALNFLSDVQSTKPGLEFCSSTLLRFAIVLLGFQVSLGSLGALGLGALLALLAVMTAALGAAILAARMTRLSTEFGLIVGGATAICGASAALLLYALIGKNKVGPDQFAAIILGILLASALAAITYPVIAAALAYTDIEAGFLTGATIHDVAQAVGAGYGISDSAGQTTTAVKMTRVMLLAPIAFGIAAWVSRNAGGEQSEAKRALQVPLFVIAYIAVVIVNSAATMPPWIGEAALDVAKVLILAGIIATVLRANLRIALVQGWRPIVPIAFATLASLLAALLLIPALF